MNSLSTQQQRKRRVFLEFRFIVTRAVLASLVVGIAACAALDRRAPQEIVKERAQARWDALVKNDLKAAYGYMSPGSRTVIPYEGWVGAIKPGFWKSAVVERVICEAPDGCDAVVKIGYVFMNRSTETLLKETWVREGSNWWYVQK